MVVIEDDNGDLLSTGDGAYMLRGFMGGRPRAILWALVSEAGMAAAREAWAARRAAATMEVKNFMTGYQEGT